MAVAVSLFIPWVNNVAGVLMLAGATIGISLVPIPLRWVAGVLSVIGLSTLSIALTRGYPLVLDQIFTVNQALIGMIAAVSFLQLITPEESSVQPRLSGRAAVWRTTGAVHLLGSVINMTVIGSAGDRLRRNRVLSTPDALLISRAFSTGAFWSPFWAASAAALAFAPEARVSIVFACGAALASMSIVFSSEATARQLGKGLKEYEGYALTRRLLQVPITMVLLIVLIHSLALDAPVTKIVLICSIVITAIMLLGQDYRGASKKFMRHAVHHVPKHQAELTLFASAGLLSVGLKALLSVTSIPIPFREFSALEAWLCIVIMIALALIGVHPVVSMAALAALTAQLDPDPTLFVLAAIIGWGSSVSIGPMSGLLIHLNGRYGVNPSAIIRGNLPYLLFVVAASYPCLVLCSVLVEV